MKRTFAIASLLASSAWGQDTLTNETIIRLKEAKMSEEFILNAIKQNNVSFTMSSGDLLALKNADVSERIIEMMFIRKLQAGGVKVDVPSAPKPEAAKPAAAPAAAPAAPAAAAAKPAPAAAAPPNLEAGLMYKKDSAWMDVLQENIEWSEKGKIKSIKKVVSMTLVKKPVEGRVAGTNSRTIVNTGSEIVIAVPPGAPIQDYVLLPFKVGKGERRVEIGPASADNKGASSRGIDFGLEKTANANQFKVSVPGGLRPGEYGVINKKQITLDGNSRIYTFRVLPAS